jgi:putative transposase
MKDDYPIEVLCEAFCVSRSGYYQWVERRDKPSTRVREDRELAEQIREVHQQSGSTYGTPRLHVELRYRGRRHSRKRIDRIRRELGLWGRQKRRYRPKTTDSAHDEPIAPNRLAELPKASRRDQIWANDITYIQTDEGWLYLAVIMDLYSRRIIGWAFAITLGPSLWRQPWRWLWCTAGHRRSLREQASSLPGALNAN